MNELPLNLLLETVMRERDEFEQQLYDFLVEPINLPEIPDDFWEPVIVNLSKQQINLLKNKLNEDECNICASICNSFKLLECCGKEMCINCSVNWFNRSIKCPFCNYDLRNLNCFKEYSI